MTDRVVLNISEAEAKVLLVLLNRAGERLSCNGCNDFSLAKDGKISLREAADVTAAMRRTMPNDPINESDQQEDFVLMGHFEILVETALKVLR